jgi:C4-dicarboxylate-binding protein DctP
MGVRGAVCARSIAAMPTRISANAPQRRHILRRLGAAACVAAVPRINCAQAAMIIRLSHVVAEDTPKGLAARRFQALVQSRSGGRLEVVVFAGARLYGDHDEMQALQLGAVEILAPSLSKFGRIGFPEFELFDLPYLFSDAASVRRITQGPLGQRLLQRLQRQQLVGLGYLDNGFKHMSGNHPLLQPEHFVGMRMRVQASTVIAAQMRALGARPVTLAFSETRRALALGVVDGTENPISNFWTQRMHEVQSDLSLSQHGYLGYALVANQRFWLGLPQDDRDLLRDALGEAMVFGNQISDTQNDKALAALRDSASTRIHVPDAAQVARMRRAVQPVYDGLAKRIGEGWLRDARNAAQAG